MKVYLCQVALKWKPRCTTYPPREDWTDWFYRAVWLSLLYVDVPYVGRSSLTIHSSSACFLWLSFPLSFEFVMELSHSARSLRFCWCAMRWIDYGRAPWLGTNLFDRRVFRVYADSQKYFLRRVRLKRLSSYVWMHRGLIVTHILGFPHLQ